MRYCGSVATNIAIPIRGGLPRRVAADADPAIGVLCPDCLAAQPAGRGSYPPHRAIAALAAGFRLPFVSGSQRAALQFEPVPAQFPLRLVCVGLPDAVAVLRFVPLRFLAVPCAPAAFARCSQRYQPEA